MFDNGWLRLLSKCVGRTHKRDLEVQVLGASATEYGRSTADGGQVSGDLQSALAALIITVPNAESSSL